MAILIRSILNLDDDTSELLTLAKQACGRVGPGTGRPPLGAAARGASGTAYPGASLELSEATVICGEQVAIGAALAAGEESISAVAIVLDPGGIPVPRDHGSHPCGRCRHLLADVGEAAGHEIAVYIADVDLTIIVVTTSGELLPEVLGAILRQKLPMVEPRVGE
jgi:cytidine deaminase